MISAEEISQAYTYADPYRKWAYKELEPGISTTTLLVLMELDIESGLRTWMTSEIVKFLKYPLRINGAHVNGIRDKLENSFCKLSTLFFDPEHMNYVTRGESLRLEKCEGQYQLVHIVHHFDQMTQKEQYAVRERHVLRAVDAICFSKPAFVEILSSYVYHGGVLCYSDADYLLEYLVL